jgi:nicotinate-nucleotide adenylyltransferase
VLNETKLQKIWFIISPQNPFKQSATLLNEYDRLFLVQKAIEGDDRLRASDIEFALPKPSYTAHTLSYLADKYPSYQFTIIMGSDSFQNLSKWHNASFIIANYPILVYRRPLFPTENTFGARVSFLDAPLLQISATHIREAVQQNKSIRYLVPDGVETEIHKSGFYKKTYKK